MNIEDGEGSIIRATRPSGLAFALEHAKAGPPFNIKITPKAVFTKLLFFIIFLLFANLTSVTLSIYFFQDDVYGLTRIFSFSAEKSVPTLYSSLTLFFCTALLAIIALIHKRLDSSHLPWLALSLIFLFLTIDETASLHEKLTTPIRESLNASGVLFFAWVIPYGVALAVFSVSYFRFLINLPRKTMLLFILSGVTYVSGAMGLEMIGGLHADMHGTSGLLYSLIITCEEFLEMLGIVFFVYALLSYIDEHFEKLTITTK